MKIEDAIEQEIKAAGYRRNAADICRAKLNNPNYPWGRDWTKEEVEEKEKRYIKEAEEHQQMAEWLEELLHFREIGTVERFKYLSKSEHNYENCHNLTCRTRCEKDGYIKAIEEFANILRAELIYTPVSCEYDYAYEIAMVDARKKVNRIEQELKGECRK